MEKNENFDDLNTDIQLFSLEKNRIPEFKSLTAENKLRILVNSLEIQSYKDNLCTDFNEFEEISLKIEKNESITSDELLKFQGTLTPYKNNPKIWNKIYSEENYDRYQKILMKAILLKDVKKSTNYTLKLNKSYGIDLSNSEDLNEFYRIILATAHKNPKIDSRANRNYLRNIDFLEELNMPDEYVNIFYEFADKIEFYYRTKTRETEYAIYGEGEELSSNHLLRVNRFGLGIMTEAWQSPDKFYPEDKAEFLKRKTNPLEILKDSLLDINHDIIEDGLITEKSLKAILYDICIKYVDKDMAEDISREISQDAMRLNSHDFHSTPGDKKSLRNYDVYLNGGTVENSDGIKKEFKPLNFRQKFTKIKDMIHNWQTAIKINNPEKIKIYLKFIADNIHYLEALRVDSISNILKYNLSQFNDKKDSDIDKIRKYLYASLKEKQQIK